VWEQQRYALQGAIAFVFVSLLIWTTFAVSWAKPSTPEVLTRQERDISYKHPSCDVLGFFVVS
jgi:hypothetical protein